MCRQHSLPEMTRRNFLPLLAGTVALALLLSVVLCAVWIRTVHYTVALEGVTTPVHAVILSDLHGREFGESNARLIRKIAEETPDVIFLVGDLLDGTAEAEDVSRLLELISSLTALAPVYFAPGNHELKYMERDETLLTRVASAGAVVVNDSFVDTEIAGQPLRIGGTMGHAFPFGRTMEAYQASLEYQFLTAFQQTDTPTVCLAHMPDTFIFNGAYQAWRVDLVLSGHTHGGLVRLPLIGGLYAPMQGFFPPYDRGLFSLGEQMQLLLTSGLAGYGWIPRVNNPPEIVVADLIPKTDS